MALSQNVAKYKMILDRLMSFIHEVDPGSEYSRDELLQVTPNHVLKWMCLQTLGTTEVGIITDASRPLVRKNTLAWWEKSISYFMPDRLQAWSSGKGEEGNPTKCLEVHDNLTNKVKKLEARKQGAMSQARRPIKQSEFCCVHQIFKKYGGCNNVSIWRYSMPALINFQFHMIARIHNTTQVILEHLRVHDYSPNALKTRLNW